MAVLTHVTAPKKKNKKKKGAKSKSNGDANKSLESERDLTIDHVDGEVDVEDSEHSTVVRRHLFSCWYDPKASTSDSVYRTHQVKTTFQ